MKALSAANAVGLFLAAALATGPAYSHVSDSQARAWLARHAKITKQEQDLVRVSDQLVEVWGRDQKLVEAATDPGFYSCASRMDDQLDQMENEIKQLQEAVGLSAGMETANDQVALSNAVWFHAKSSLGYFQVLNAPRQASARDCPSFAAEWAAVDSWEADARPVLQGIADDAGLESGQH